MEKNSSGFDVELQVLTEDELRFVSGGECEGGTGHPVTVE